MAKGESAFREKPDRELNPERCHRRKSFIRALKLTNKKSFRKRD
jgi:hypothetical protein